MHTYFIIIPEVTCSYMLVTIWENFVEGFFGSEKKVVGRYLSDRSWWVKKSFNFIVCLPIWPVLSHIGT